MTTLRDLVAKIFIKVEGHEHLEQLSEQIEGIHKKVELLAGIELAKFLYEAVEGFSGLGEKLESAAVAAGVTTDTFQQMAYAASQNAVSQEELSGAMARYSRMIGAARDGSKEALAMFAKVGISKEQVDGFADASEGMQVLADHIQAIEDPIKRTQLLMGLLGRGSAHMTKLMVQGGQGIRNKMAEAKAINATVSTQNIEQLAELEDSVSSLGLVFKAAAMNLAGYFSPAIVEAINRVKAFWIANHAVIEQTFEEYANKAGFALGMVIGILQGASEALFDFIKTHRKLIDTIGELIVGFIEFKIAVGLIGAVFSSIVGPFKQIKDAFLVLKGTYDLFKVGAPIIKRFGGAIVEYLGMVAEAAIGVGGLPGIAIMGALVTLIHDIYTYMTTGDVTKMWLYQLIMAIKSLSLGALKKLGLYTPTDDVQAAKDKVMQDMPLAAVGGDAVGGKAMDFSALPDQTGNFMSNVGDLTHAQNLPPSMLDRAGPQAAVGSMSYNVDAPITVNVPPNADPKAVAQAAKDGIKDALSGIMRQANNNLTQSMAH